MRRLTLWFCLSCFLVPIGASADSVEVVLTGVVDTVTDPLSQLDPAIVPGSLWSGTYVFDSVSPGVLTSGGGLVNYNPDPTSSVSITVEGNNFVTAPEGVLIANDIAGFGQYTGDTIDLWVNVGSGVEGKIDPFVGFVDPTFSRISDPTDYFVNTSLAGWDTIGGELGLNQLQSGVPVNLLIGTITSIQIAPTVPSLAPLGIALLSGLMALAGWRGLRA